MELVEAENLPAELRLALAYTPREIRPRLATAFALDRRLGQIVAQATEPMLAQMRLAWWREQLALPSDQRPKGDAVLGAISEYWSDAGALGRLVDGWEYLLEEGTLSEVPASGFAEGRVAALTAAVDHKGEVALSAPGAIWAFADAAARSTNERERDLLVALGLAAAKERPKAGRADRGLVVLDALALRSLKSGGRPLMEGRSAAITALWAGLRATFTAR